MSEEKNCLVKHDGLERLIQVLQAQEYTVIGPRLRDEAIVYDVIKSIDDLPAGWSDEQAPGYYRLQKRSDQALFAYNVSPHSWKRFLYPPHQMLWRMRRDENGITCDEPKAAPRYAFLGVRACELKAIAIQDSVFLKHDHPDPVYQQRREQALFIAVNCTRAGATCFCTSMDSGPRASDGFDLAITELLDDQRHEFLMESGSDRGAELLQAIYFDSDGREADSQDLDSAQTAIDHCADTMGRQLDSQAAHQALFQNLEHPRWDEVAERCLSCANCTMVCPTCFCSDVEDTTDLSGDIAERWRSWSSCFDSSFTDMGGHAVRHSTRSRYRQWLTHKLSTWHEQFDSSGCVGCGRCITWCPVGIDMTEEASAIINNPQQPTDGDS